MKFCMFGCDNNVMINQFYVIIDEFIQSSMLIATWFNFSPSILPGQFATATELG